MLVLGTSQETLTDEEIEALEVSYLGPTWERGESGKFLLPSRKRSLGWQILEWAESNLLHFDGSGRKFEPTFEQSRFILHWYKIDEHGEFVNRTGVLQRLKGWGKDPLLAVLCLVEFVGPSRFGGWNDDGTPIAVPHPHAWVQVTAVNQQQTRNTMRLLPQIVSPKMKEIYGIKDGAELWRANNGRCHLEAVTSSFRALEGGRTTFTLLNETQHWIQGNNGHEMYETIDGNATKTNSRYLAITNAFLPGEDSVAERMRDAYDKILEGKAVDNGFLYDSIEAHPKTPLTPEALRIVVPKIRGDAVWLNVEAIIKSVLSLTISPARSRRMWLNQIWADEDAIYAPGMWKALEDPDAVLLPGEKVVLGFDGGKTDDSTALIAIRVADAVAFVLGHWEKPDGPRGEDWEVPREEVDSYVRHAFQAYKVVAMYADVYLWESYISDWTRDFAEGLAVKATGNSPIGWDMRSSLKKSTYAHERLMRTIFDGKLHHDGDRALARHVMNARRRLNNFGIYFGKESPDSKRKVDLYAALMLAYEALHDYRVRGRKQKERTGRGYFL